MQQTPRSSEAPPIAAQATSGSDGSVTAHTARTRQLTAPDFAKRKKSHRKISMITCYDATFAKIIAQSPIDCVLVGDSCAMVVHGQATTIGATMDMMAMHTRAVRTGLQSAGASTFLIADMPFLSFRSGLEQAVKAAGALMQAGADAVKIEGVDGHGRIIHHLVQSGIPVMGHLGLTPQSYHTLGGYKIQGRTDGAAEILKAQAIELQSLGCFAIVLECIPERLGGEISRLLSIPTIGIGAGREVDGQVLVLHDLLGLSDFTPTFVRRYIDGSALVSHALQSYCDTIAAGTFPGPAEVFDA